MGVRKWHRKCYNVIRTQRHCVLSPKYAMVAQCHEDTDDKSAQSCIVTANDIADRQPRLSPVCYGHYDVR